LFRLRTSASKLAAYIGFAAILTHHQTRVVRNFCDFCASWRTIESEESQLAATHGEYLIAVAWTLRLQS
jgi:hypothetical protein